MTKRSYADPAPGSDAIVVIGSAAWADVLADTRSGLSPIRTKIAISKTEAFFAEHPEQRASLGFRLADLYFRENRNAQAYRLLAPLAVPDAMDEILLRASIAAAMRGEVYAGQRQYCLDSLGWLSAESLVGTAPKDDSAASVLTLSYLATASDANLHGDLDNAAFYAGRAIARDPGNPLASLILGQLAMQRRRYAEATALFAKGSTRAKGDLAQLLRVARSKAAEQAALVSER